MKSSISLTFCRVLALFIWSLIPCTIHLKACACQFAWKCVHLGVLLLYKFSIHDSGPKDKSEKLLCIISLVNWII